MPAPARPAAQPQFASTGTQVTAPTVPQQTAGFSETEPVNKYTLHWLFWNIWSWFQMIIYFLFDDPGREHGHAPCAFHPLSASAANCTLSGTKYSFSTGGGTICSAMAYLRPGDVIGTVRWNYGLNTGNVIVTLERFQISTGLHQAVIATHTDAVASVDTVYDLVCNHTVQADYAYYMTITATDAFLYAASSHITHPTLV